MTSTLILYKDCRILPDRNFKVDDLSSYLASLTKQTISDFQFQKHSLKRTIKISAPQTTLEFLSTYNVNYCSITNTSEETTSPTKEVFYFIVDKKWGSEKCVELYLELDTINSFLDNCVISDKTKILREHKDRYRVVYGQVYTFTDYQNPPVILSPNVNYFFKLSNTGGAIKTEVLTSRIYFLISNENENAAPSSIRVSQIVILQNAIRITLWGKTQRTQDFSLEAHKYGFYITNSLGITMTGNFSSSIGGYFTYEQQPLQVIPQIDFYSEGLHPVLFQKESHTIKDTYAIEDTNEDEENSFYLIYKTRTSDENSPVDVFLCSDAQMQVNASDNKRNGTLYVQRPNVAVYTIPSSNENIGGVLSFRKEGEYIPTQLTIESGKAYKFYSLASIYGGYSMFVRIYSWNSSLNRWDTDAEYRLGSSEVAYTNLENIRIYDMNINSPQDLSDEGEAYFSDSGSSTTSINSIKSLDRTDTKLVKVIKLPYSPTGLSKVDGKYLFDESVWEIGSDVGYQFLKLLDNDVKFEKSINYFGVSPYDVMHNELPSTFERVAKSIDLEPKLFHSDFYTPKLVYDSFAFEFHLEEFQGEFPISMELTFVQTSTINSRFMFVLNEYQTMGRTKKDFYNVLPVARNNELVLYNSSYLNYIRTGYNYDVKTKERNETMQIASAIGKTVGSIASFAINPALGVGLLASTILSYISTANSIAQSEQNIEQKLAQTKMQAVSVAGSDDVDLMTYYTDNNKAMLKIYQVSDKLRKALFDLFYYQGYIADYFGIPSTNTRVNFNFVSAEVVFSQLPNLSQDIVEDLKQKYGLGITFLHKWENAWDFDQQYENWESSLFEGE